MHCKIKDAKLSINSHYKHHRHPQQRAACGGIKYHLNKQEAQPQSCKILLKTLTQKTFNEW